MKLLKILQTAVKYNASDVYISTGERPGLRINGNLVFIEDHPVVSAKMAEEYILETMSEQQRARFARMLDFDYALEVDGLGRFRVNAFMQRKGIAAVFRLIPEDILTLDQLNLPSQLKKIVNFKQGIVLVTGPTGSGKSTTLASIVDEINRTYSYNILTVEDPIEFVHSNKKSLVQQREVGEHTKSFGSALRSALRESMDIVLVGEMRDHETISLALTAAETGHLVLSTLHTSGAAKSIDRVIDVFPASQQEQIRTQLAMSLRAVVWQQLIPRSDGQGRVAALEILFANNAVQNLIRKGKTFQLPLIMETGMREGMQTMQKSITDLQGQGYFDQDTADRYLAALSDTANIDETD